MLMWERGLATSDHSVTALLDHTARAEMCLRWVHAVLMGMLESAFNGSEHYRCAEQRAGQNVKMLHVMAHLVPVMRGLTQL